MRILFFSDVHGVPETLKRLLEKADELQAEQLVLLGDALYHGPRNGVPGFYDPVQVAGMLNSVKEKLIAVRGNCDSEVDQMMLHFPVMSDFSELLADGQRFFLTHGHVWNAGNMPPLPNGTVLAHGHTHIPEITDHESGKIIFNPGSISLPKQNFMQTFGFFDGKTLSVRKLADGTELLSKVLQN